MKLVVRADELPVVGCNGFQLIRAKRIAIRRAARSRACGGGHSGEGVRCRACDCDYLINRIGSSIARERNCGGCLVHFDVKRQGTLLIAAATFAALPLLSDIRSPEAFIRRDLYKTERARAPRWSYRRTFLCRFSPSGITLGGRCLHFRA